VIKVSTVNAIGDAQISFDDLVTFDKHGLGEKFIALLRACGRARGFGDFWSHMLVAEGAAEIAIEPQVSLWDVAAIQIIVEEAGGRFTDLSGAERADGGSGVSSNGLLHEAALAAVHR
jgi:histidinol-phosphatase